ncbi:broad specificity phosphatase PhoE [Palleronia aestuarii]|uniref:Broad specificity phosphatase PhoE n=1 Tax=Palleronia aestuarii TaxID=568105 RepID=A0A2W7NEQ1_9RHOB|nr:histidine phosphatase family protein [Palleronia aestuarii]PZX18400.1 broad specificity phosphatase PhoE [Palleronia aestuarii]
MTRLWFIRHGPTHARGMVGHSDIAADLSDLEAIDRLEALLPKDAPVLSSDLSRAVRTADALQKSRPRLPHDPDLREMHFGEWELREHDEISAETPDLAFAFWDRPGDVRPPGGESWNDLCRRADRAVDLLAEFGGDVIVVAHFGVILSQYQRAAGLRPKEAMAQRIAPLSLTRIRAGADWAVETIDHHP